MAQGGKPFYDRKLAGDVRTKALEDVLLILDNDPSTKDWSDLKKQMLLKLSSNLLPRLQEVSGTDGEPLVVQFSNAFTSSQTD